MNPKLFKAVFLITSLTMVTSCGIKGKPIPASTLVKTTIINTENVSATIKNQEALKTPADSTKKLKSQPKK